MVVAGYSSLDNTYGTGSNSILQNWIYSFMPDPNIIKDMKKSLDIYIAKHGDNQTATSFKPYTIFLSIKK